MKSTIARAILQKGFFLWDYGTYSKSVSGEREALLKKLIFFWTALVYMSLKVLIIKRTQKASRKRSQGRKMDNWEKAIVEELSCLLQNETSEEVPKPKNKTFITCKKKLNANGKVIQYKARLVAKGLLAKIWNWFRRGFCPCRKKIKFQSTSYDSSP